MDELPSIFPFSNKADNTISIPAIICALNPKNGEAHSNTIK